MPWHEEVSQAAFDDQHNTRFGFPEANSNGIIGSHHNVDIPFTYDAHQLWDMEVRKAYQPDQYLHHIVPPGSLKIFSRSWKGS